MAESTDSVTQWLRLIEQGEETAAAELWQRYSQRLTALAKARLRGSNDPWADEEDLALCVFASLLQRIQAGKVERIESREHLWRLLAWATRRRAADQLRRENAQKRKPHTLQACIPSESSDDDAGRIPVYKILFQAGELDQTLLDQRLPAELMVDFLDEFRFLESKLPSQQLQQIARLKFDGWKNQEIAEHLETSLSSIERKLRIMREIWLKELSS